MAMKHFALIATSIALLGAGASAQKAAPNTRTVRVTKNSAVSFYSIPESELTSKESYIVTSSGGVTYDDKSGEAQCEGDVTIQIGKSFKIHATKATVNMRKEEPFILVQSSGSIESIRSSRIQGEVKHVQFILDGTRIELLKN